MKKKTKNNIRLPKGDGLNLPKSWEIKKLGEVCEILDKLRKPITKRNRIAGEYPYYGATGILDYVHDYIFDEKLVLIGEDGAKWNSGERSAFIAEGKYWVNNHAHVVKPNRNILIDEWIINFLNFSDLSDYVSGMTVPKLNQGNLKQIQVPIPPLPEQKRIVALLDRIFSAIERSRNIAEQNLKNAKELFQSKLQAIFESGKLKMESGEWEEKKLGGLGKVQTGSTPPTKDKSNYGDYIPFAKPPHFKSNGDIETEESMLSKIGLKKGRLFDANSILMVCIGATIGKTGFSEKPISANQQINGLTPFQNYYARFFYYAFISDTIQKQILKQGKSAQATLPIINKTKWENILVSFPKSMQEQKQIVAQLDTLQAETKKLEAIYQQKIDNLDELKKSILQKAFRGEL